MNTFSVFLTLNTITLFLTFNYKLYHNLKKKLIKNVFVYNNQFCIKYTRKIYRFIDCNETFELVTVYMSVKFNSFVKIKCPFPVIC